MQTGNQSKNLKMFVMKYKRSLHTNIGPIYSPCIKKPNPSTTCNKPNRTESQSLHSLYSISISTYSSPISIYIFSLSPFLSPALPSLNPISPFPSIQRRRSIHTLSHRHRDRGRNHNESLYSHNLFFFHFPQPSLSPSPNL